MSSTAVTPARLPSARRATSSAARRANLLVDSPRAAEPLLRRLEELGGVRFLVLTHQDDVADHEAMARRFGCERVLHQADVTRGTADVERKVAGSDPIGLAEDLLLIPVPGHTRGSVALLFRGVLFSGDHLWADEKGRLEASRGVCWYSWEAQIESLRRLLGFRFSVVLPGHRRRYRAESPEEARAELARLVSRLAG